MSFLSLYLPMLAEVAHRDSMLPDRTTGSPAAGNLRMWMFILVLLHAAAILAIIIFEL